MRATWKRFSRCPIAEVEARWTIRNGVFGKLIAPGGPVWLDVEIASANRDGEIARVEALQQKRDEAEVVADMVVLVEEHRLIAGMAAAGGGDQIYGLVCDIIEAIARPGC